jgi:alpha-glucosidase
MSNLKKKILLLFFLISLIVTCGRDNQLVLLSPDKQVSVVISRNDESGYGSWSYSVYLEGNGKKIQVIEASSLGLKRNDGDFFKNLELVNVSEVSTIDESYTLLAGKRKHNRNHANQFTLSFRNTKEQPLDILFRAYDSGVAFRYIFPDESSEMHTVEEEFTSFNLPQPGKAWLQPYDTLGVWNPAYERGYVSDLKIGDPCPMTTGWGFPGLFQVKDYWVLISESGVYENYCGSHLKSLAEKGEYRIEFPWQWENYGLGETNPSSTLPWMMPWRFILVSSDLGDIVESNIVDDLAEPNRLNDISWIKPGRSSWSWWGDHESPFDYQKLKDYVDFAAEMGWEYSLVDAGWHEMKGGNIRDLVNYANSKNVWILLWYNSGGPHTRVMDAGPRDRMYDPEIRKAEFEKISEWGVKGVKVDFFQSEKQGIMKLYLDILKNAAEYNIVVNTHGCTIPRGWSRTYPNFLTMEGVKGAEAYTYEKSIEFPCFNNVYPYTRNVIGPMDYTPVTFTNYKESQRRVTTNTHELALSVIFESGIQHLADRITGYGSTPQYVQDFLKTVPVAWDETWFVDGYPGEFTVLAREKNDEIYVAGIFNNPETKNCRFTLPFLSDRTWEGYLISDGDSSKKFKMVSLKVDRENPIMVTILPYGGFVGKLD